MYYCDILEGFLTIFDKSGVKKHYFSAPNLLHRKSTIFGLMLRAAFTGMNRGPPTRLYPDDIKHPLQALHPGLEMIVNRLKKNKKYSEIIWIIYYIVVV